MAKNNVSICCDLSVFDGRLNYIRPASLLLTLLVMLRDTKTNKVKLSYNDGEELLKEEYKRVTSRSIKNWLRRLGQNGAIKRKFNGEIIVNPYYVYDGTKQDFDACVVEWERFRGVDVVVG